MIPIQDALPPRTRPWAVWTIALVNLTVFLVGRALGPEGDANLLVTGAMIPAMFTWTTAFTSLVLHQSGIHLILNLFALVVIGENVEDRMGHARFVVFYVAAGLTSMLVAVWINPTSMGPLLGAGGAIAAVLGAHLMLFPHGRVLMFPVVVMDLLEMPSGLLMTLWFLLQVFGGFASVAGMMDPGVGAILWVPLSGLAFGAIGVWVLRRPERQRAEWWAA